MGVSLTTFWYTHPSSASSWHILLFDIVDMGQGDPWLKFKMKSEKGQGSPATAKQGEGKSRQHQVAGCGPVVGRDSKALLFSLELEHLYTPKHHPRSPNFPL